LIAARALDAYSTWIATRDLSLEMNPLTRFFHLGWRGLLLVNAFIVVLMLAAIWRASFAPPPLPAEQGLDLDAFVSRFWFARGGRRSLSQAVWYLPADRRIRWAFIGGPGAAIMIVASVVLAGWNLLVAHNAVSPAMARVWLVAFWSGVAMSLALGVRIFVLRAYARYAR